MRRYLTVALIPLLALLVLPADAVGLVYPCYHPDVPPVLDGDVRDDPAWQNIPAATGFSVLGGDFTEAKQTSFQACWDDAALYLAVTCEEPDVSKMVLKIRHGGEVWLDDGIEVFVQPTARGQTYQFGVTAGAARGCGEGSPDILKYQAARSVGDDFYTLEIRIPHELIGATPAVGDLWRGNVCRNIFTTNSGGDKFTSWAPLQRRFLEPEHFADIELRGPAPDAAQVTAINEALNLHYRTHLLALLRGVSAQGDEYLPALGEATDDAQFGHEAKRLRNQWRRLQRLAQDTSEVPVAQVREMLRGADALARASYELKYAYLIAQLFSD